MFHTAYVNSLKQLFLGQVSCVIKGALAPAILDLLGSIPRKSRQCCWKVVGELAVVLGMLVVITAVLAVVAVVVVVVVVVVEVDFQIVNAMRSRELSMSHHYLLQTPLLCLRLHTEPFFPPPFVWWHRLVSTSYFASFASLAFYNGSNASMDMKRYEVVPDPKLRHLFSRELY